MKVQIEVSTDNAAFEDSPDELFRILKDAAWQAHNMVHGHEASGVLHDVNGNTVGHVHMFDEELESGPLVKEARKEEKREWFEKVKSQEFWENLWNGVDGEEGKQYAIDVYDILYEIFGEKG